MSLLTLNTPPEPQELGKFIPPTESYSVGSDTNEGVISNLELIISNIIGFLTVLGAVFFVFQFVLGAIQWISSGGDKGKLEKARNQMMNGAIGMIILIASYAVVGLISNLIGFDLLNPGEALKTIIPTTGTSTSTTN